MIPSKGISPTGTNNTGKQLSRGSHSPVIHQVLVTFRSAIEHPFTSQSLPICLPIITCQPLVIELHLANGCSHINQLD